LFEDHKDRIFCTNHPRMYLSLLTTSEPGRLVGDDGIEPHRRYFTERRYSDLNPNFKCLSVSFGRTQLQHFNTSTPQHIGTGRLAGDFLCIPRNGARPGLPRIWSGVEREIMFHVDGAYSTVALHPSAPSTHYRRSAAGRGSC